jgi:hypothetical protein
MDGKRTMTLVVLLDAFRKDYILRGNMKFLSEFDKIYNGCEVQQSFGFCERTEILHGKTPEDEGFFTAIALKENQIPYYNRLRSLINTFLNIQLIEKVVRLSFRLVNKITRVKIPIYKIPITEMGMWEFTEDKLDITNPHTFKDSPLLTLIEKYKVSFKHFTSLDRPVIVKDDNLRLFKSLEEFKNNDIVFVYYGLTDYLAHIHGPNSERFNEFLSKLDKTLLELHEKLVEKNIKLTILGDHGMLEVENQLNIQSIVQEILNPISLFHTKDYVSFTDSTLFRIYLKDKSCVGSVYNILKQSLNHRILIEENSVYGDIIIEAEDGELFYPNNFNHAPLKGMHGYRSTSIENKGYFVSELNTDKKSFDGNLNLKDFMFKLNELLA